MHYYWLIGINIDFRLHIREPDLRRPLNAFMEGIKYESRRLYTYLPKKKKVEEKKVVFPVTLIITWGTRGTACQVLMLIILESMNK